MLQTDNRCSAAASRAVLVIWAILTPTAAHACDYLTMRDAGFDEPRDVHRLCVFGHREDDQGRAIFARLDAWLQTEARELNLSLEYVPVDAPDIEWEEYGVPSAPQQTPAVALIGRAVGRRPWVIDAWVPDPDKEDLACLLDSPARRELRTQLGNHLAVMVYMPRGPGAPSAEAIIQQTVDAWAEKMDQHLGLAVVTVDRDDPRERVLRAFTKLSGYDGSRLAVVFGRGKFLEPMFKADEITAVNLEGQLRTLMEECTCLRSPRTLGVDVTMPWNDDYDSDVIPLKSPDSPAVDSPVLALATERQQDTAGTHVLRRTVWTMVALAGAILLGVVVIIGIRPGRPA